MQGLIDAAVMIVTMIIPTLFLKGFEKTSHAQYSGLVRVATDAVNSVGENEAEGFPNRINEKCPSGGTGRRSRSCTWLGLLLSQAAKRSQGKSERQPSSLAIG